MQIDAGITLAKIVCTAEKGSGAWESMPLELRSFLDCHALDLDSKVSRRRLAKVKQSSQPEYVVFRHLSRSWQRRRWKQVHKATNG